MPLAGSSSSLFRLSILLSESKQSFSLLGMSRLWSDLGATYEERIFQLNGRTLQQSRWKAESKNLWNVPNEYLMSRAITSMAVLGSVGRLAGITQLIEPPTFLHRSPEYDGLEVKRRCFFIHYYDLSSDRTGPSDALMLFLPL